MLFVYISKIYKQHKDDVYFTHEKRTSVLRAGECVRILMSLTENFYHEIKHKHNGKIPKAKQKD